MYTADQIREANHAKAAEMIRQQLASNDQWLLRGLLAIYRHQTRDEQTAQTTKYHNGVGFTGSDAYILTSFAKQVERWQNTPVEHRQYANPLSCKQTTLARKRMLKYAGQLARIVHPKQEN